MLQNGTGYKIGRDEIHTDTRYLFCDDNAQWWPQPVGNTVRMVPYLGTPKPRHDPGMSIIQPWIKETKKYNQDNSDKTSM